MSEESVEIDGRKLPDKVSAADATEVDPKDYGLIGLDMQEPQYLAPCMRKLVDKVARSKVPCLSMVGRGQPQEGGASFVSLTEYQWLGLRKAKNRQGRKLSLTERMQALTCQDPQHKTQSRHRAALDTNSPEREWSEVLLGGFRASGTAKFNGPCFI